MSRLEQLVGRLCRTDAGMAFYYRCKRIGHASRSSPTAGAEPARPTPKEHEMAQVVHVETLLEPGKYSPAQIELAFAVQACVRRDGKLVLVEPPRSA